MAHFHGPGGFADAEVANDVHLMILDHLAYQATQALLADLSAADATNGHRARDHFLESHLELFSSYFRLSSPELQSSFDGHASSAPHIPSSTILRVQLLQFVTGYHTNRNPSTGPSRFTQQSLELLRRDNYERALLWTKHCNDNAEDCEAVESLLHEDDGQEHTSENEQWQTAPLLLDLIPAFIALTAARMSLGNRDGQQANDNSSQPASEDNREPDGWRISEAWLYLAAELMLQASLENRGSMSARTWPVAFCWGPLEPDASLEQADTSLDILALNSVFDTRRSRSRSRASSHGSEMDIDSPDWETIRETYKEHAQKLSAQCDNPATRDLHAEHSARLFHEKLTGYLNAVASSIAPPLLSQLDQDDDNEEIVLEELELTAEESRRLRAIARGITR